jgi:hypothetical protein
VVLAVVEVGVSLWRHDPVYGRNTAFWISHLDEVYLAFQTIESGDMVVTVAAQPDRRN